MEGNNNHTISNKNSSRQRDLSKAEQVGRLEDRVRGFNVPQSSP